MRTRDVRILAVAGLACAFLPLAAACGKASSDSIASARALADAPTWVRTPTGTDCGEIELDAGSTIPETNLDCLADAQQAGRQASLAWVERTTEGDPVPAFVRVWETGLTVASTSAYDAYGPGTWSEHECVGTVSLSDCLDEAK